MTEDWGSGDPFSDSEDPQAAAREQRRREREEKRRGREAKREETEAAAPPPPPPPPPDPPVPPRTPEEDFWDEDPAEPSAPSPPAPGKAASRPASPPRGPRPPRPGSGALAALRHHPLRVLGVIAALFVLWFLFALFQPFHGDGSGRVVVTIPKGASVSEVGDMLDENGVVSSSTLFQLRVTIAGKRSDLYPGRFVLAEGMSYGSAIDALSTAPLKKVAVVTIPEGYSRAQAAPLAKEAGLTGSYLDASVHSKYLDPARYGGKDAKNLEGFLFPDTFELKPNAPVADLVQLQLQDFKRRIKGLDMSYAKKKNLTVYDVVTIASMVEREAMVDRERPLVAAVIYNRLHEGMPLGIDATTRFATGNYEEPLTESELAIDSPYNTRTHDGLPPGPIDSPGLASIEAAARPAKVDYLFYVVKPGACGEHAFSSTEAEFEADVSRYDEARAAAGGESPDSC
jgi:peptidoglycan lytic transglycosylase G